MCTPEGPQSHDVTLNAIQVLQVQQAMKAQAATTQKEAEALIQTKIDTEVEKRTLGLVVLPPPSPAKPKTKTVKTADDLTWTQMTTGFRRRQGRRRGRSAVGNMLNEQRKWRIFVTAFTCSRKHYFE